MSYDSLLINKCSIYKRTTSQDASGQEIETWVSQVNDIKCRFQAIGGNEYRGTNQILYKATHRLFLKEVLIASGLTEWSKQKWGVFKWGNMVVSASDLDCGEYRVLFGSKNYNIVHTEDAGGEGHHYELLLEYVK